MLRAWAAILLVLAFLVGTADADVQLGRPLLFNNGEPTTSGIVSARNEFAAAVQANPGH